MACSHAERDALDRCSLFGASLLCPVQRCPPRDRASHRFALILTHTENVDRRKTDGPEDVDRRKTDGLDKRFDSGSRLHFMPEKCCLFLAYPSLESCSCAGTGPALTNKVIPLAHDGTRRWVKHYASDTRWATSLYTRGLPTGLVPVHFTLLLQTVYPSTCC